MRRLIHSPRLLAALIVCLAPALLLAQPGRRGMGADPTFVRDRDTFHFLLANHDKLRRQVTERLDGVETVTETDDESLVERLQEHVEAMYDRVEKPAPIRMRDPLFREIFRHTKQIVMEMERTPKGVKVVETSADPYVAELIKAHAKVVSGFIARGFDEARQLHAVPSVPAKVTETVAALPVQKVEEKAAVNEEAAVPAEETAQRQAASNARDDLAKRLSTRLVQAMSNGGPAKAIDVCSKEAPRIAKAVGKEHGLKIGRTSFKLRNPENAPPDWAKMLVEKRIAEPTYAALTDGALGAMLPIRVNAQCLACHGPTDRIAADVKAQLAAKYPKDHATGFKDGDLRGWFWVEIPPTDTKSK